MKNDKHLSQACVSMLDAGENGVTLVELLVGMVLAVVVTAAGFTALTGSNKATQINDQTAQTQQNARIAMELLARDIKVAGFGTTAAVGGCNTGIVPSDNNIAGADTGPDRISMVVPTTSAVNPLWTLAAEARGPFNSIQLQNGAIDAMTTAGLSANGAVSIGGAVSVSATANNQDLNLGSTFAAPMVFPVGTQIFLLDCITYQVIRAGDANVAVCGGNAPCLVRGVSATRDCNTLPNTCVAIAEGIEDLQLAYACDGCNATVNGGIADRVIDDQGAIDNTFDTNDFISNSAWATQPMVPDTIRLIRISVVARQTQNDQGFSEGKTAAISTRNAIIVEDHDPSNDAGFDMATYQLMRRRLLTRTVEARNVGLGL
jgi:type IV pilus assembly protein PilW